MTVVFSIYSPKIRKLIIFVPNLRIFILHQTLQLIKLEGINFKYDNDFHEFQSENIQIKHFCRKCKYFSFLHEISDIEKFEGTDIENGNSFFQILSKNTQVRSFLWKFKSFSLKVQLWVNLILFIKTWLLISKCYSRIDKNYIFSNRRWEIIFYIRQILNGIALS